MRTSEDQVKGRFLARYKNERSKPADHTTLFTRKRFIPASRESAFNREMAQWAIVFLSLVGGYVLFRMRDSDLEFYRSRMTATEETGRALERRSRKIGLVGGALIALGSIYLVVLLIREMKG